MLIELKRLVAYICPICSNISSKNMSVFNFSGRDKVRLICPTHGCHEQCVEITAKDNRYKLNIECPLCGGNHSYKITNENFWNKKLITYKCPAAGMDIFFAGDSHEVEKALEDSSDIYSDIIDEFDYESDSAFHVLFSIIEQLHKFQDKHGISCRCGSNTASINVINGNVILSCQRCGQSKVIETSEETLADLLASEQITI